MFEGEGCIYVPKKGAQIRISITSTDYDVLESVLKVAGIGVISKPRMPDGIIRMGSGSGKKPCWKWYVTGVDAVQAVLLRLRPYLHQRRLAKCDEALAAKLFDRTRPGGKGYRDADPDRLCRQDLHPMRDSRICRECSNDRSRKNYARSKALGYGRSDAYWLTTRPKLLTQIELAVAAGEVLPDPRRF